MKLNKSKLYNVIFLIVIVLFIMPQTRQPIQVFLQKGLAQFSPSVVSEKEQTKITDYNWELIDKQGANFNFRSVKGKVVLVNFWATWCPPCIAEMPNMQLLYNDYKNKIEFVFVSSDSFRDVTSFLDKNEYTFESYKPITGSEFFSVKSIPRTYLIDKEGHVVVDKTGAANWNSDSVRETIDSLLK